MQRPHNSSDLDDDTRAIIPQIGHFSFRIDCFYSCKIATKSISGKKCLKLKLDNIREAIYIFEEYKEFHMLSGDECFENLFSISYIEHLLNIMKNQEGLLSMYITPVLAQLCDDKSGERNKDSSSWSWCFEKDYSKNISDYKNNIMQIKK